MKIYLIIGQRKERYLGEYAPEVLDAIDEFGYDENPEEWCSIQINKYMSPDRAKSDFENVVSVAISVPTKEIMDILRPLQKPIEAKII